MKICIIGCGSHSDFVHGPSLRQYAARHGYVELAACCDLREDVAAAYAQKHGFARHFTDIDAMLNAVKPDWVSVVMPVSLCEPVALRVLTAGYPCMVEKPPAEDVLGVLRLTDSAQRAGVPLRVAFNRRFAPLTRLLRSELAEHPDDTVQSLSYDMHRYRRSNEEFSYTALHGIDLVRHVAGCDYAELRFDRADAPDNSINTFIRGRMDSGAAVSLTILPNTGRAIERLTVQTNRRAYFMDIPVNLDDGGRLAVFEDNKPLYERTADECGDGGEFWSIGGFYHEYASFGELIRGGAAGSVSDTVSPISDALQSMAVANAMRDGETLYAK